jgi:hypothetical protein
LVIGNEATGDRPWIGKIYYIAIFDSALSGDKIRHNYYTGLRARENEASMKIDGLRTKGPIIRYLFDERKKSVIHDSGVGLKPVNLSIPKFIWRENKPFLDFSVDFFLSKKGFFDILINILIFIPLGIFIHGTLKLYNGLTLRSSLATLFVGSLLALFAESLQHFSIARNSSFIDIITNIIGIILGIVIYRIYNLFLRYKARRLQMFLVD